MNFKYYQIISVNFCILLKKFEIEWFVERENYVKCAKNHQFVPESFKFPPRK